MHIRDLAEPSADVGWLRGSDDLANPLELRQSSYSAAAEACSVLCLPLFCPDISVETRGKAGKYAVLGFRILLLATIIFRDVSIHRASVYAASVCKY